MDSKYGHHAWLKGIVRPSPAGRSLFTFYHLATGGAFLAATVEVDPKDVKKGRLRVLVMDRDHSDQHTQVMLPTHDFLVAVVPDEHLSVRRVVSWWKRKARARRSEV